MGCWQHIFLRPHAVLIAFARPFDCYGSVRGCFSGHFCSLFLHPLCLGLSCCCCFMFLPLVSVSLSQLLLPGSIPGNLHMQPTCLPAASMGLSCREVAGERDAAKRTARTKTGVSHFVHCLKASCHHGAPLVDPSLLRMCGGYFSNEFAGDSRLFVR